MWYDSVFCGAFPKNLSKKKWNAIENMREVQLRFFQLYNLALRQFEWSGLPDTCSERFLEMCLLSRGAAMMTKEEGGFLIKGAAPGGKINTYGDYLEMYGWGLIGNSEKYKMFIPGSSDSREVTKTFEQNLGPSFNAVLCRDSWSMFPYIEYILSDATRLADIQRSIDVAAKNLKTPVIAGIPKTLYSSVQEILDQRNDNADTIFRAEGLDLDGVKLFDLKPNVETPRALRELYEWVENRNHTIFGIETATQTDKEERLLVDEVNATKGVADLNVQIRLQARKEFCEHLKDAFGLNVSVKLRNGGEDYVDTDELAEAKDLRDDSDRGGPRDAV